MRPFPFISVGCCIVYALIVVAIVVVTGCSLIGGGSAQRVVIPDPGKQEWSQDHNIRRVFDSDGNVVVEEVMKHEAADVLTPEGPDEGAAFTRASDGAVTMSTGGGADPIILKAGWYANPITWVGVGLFVFGVLSYFLRGWPPLAWMPKGLSLGSIAGGFGVIFMARVLENPFMVIIVGLVVAGAIAYGTGALDNLQIGRKLKELENGSPPTPPPPPPPPAPVEGGA